VNVVVGVNVVVDVMDVIVVMVRVLLANLYGDVILIKTTEIDHFHFKHSIAERAISHAGRIVNIVNRIIDFIDVTGPDASNPTL
jgi:hypothetical protein